MSTWREERRADQAAAAEEDRRNREFEDERRRKNRKADRDEQRQEKAQRRRERAQRRQMRAARREKTLTPGNVYRKGTLGLVAASALASLPAQIIHFVSLSWMLLPIGPALEGAAWVLAAGVAYADERRLAPWVRWLLRALSLSAAGFAAYINYEYGQSLPATTDLTASEAGMVSTGLAAVTLGGPLFFEVRQWVITLSESALSPKEKAVAKARAKHEKNRAKAFAAVAKRAEQLMLAAPFGTLQSEAAFARAWADVEGAPVGVTASVTQSRLEAEARMAAVLAEAEKSPEATAVDLLLSDIFGTPGADGGAAGRTSGKGSQGGPQGVGGGSTLTLPGGSSEGPTTLGGKGKRGSQAPSKEADEKPLAEADLEAVRKLAQTLGDPSKLTHSMVKAAVGGGRAKYLVRLRKAVQNEGR